MLKKYIADITPSPLIVTISARAMRASLGLADIVGDVVQAVPAERLVDCPMLGLAVRSDNKGVIGANRVLVLVQGSGNSNLRPLGTGQGNFAAETFRVTSEKVRCLLSVKETHIDLHGYCDFQNMLQYRLDKDDALILVSAISAGPHGRPVLTVELMQKVGQSQKASLLQSLAVEWKTALTDNALGDVSAYESPTKLDYWELPARKLRRIHSEAPSPKAAA